MTSFLPLAATVVVLATALGAVAGLSWLLTRRDNRAAARMGASTEEQVTDFINVIRAVTPARARESMRALLAERGLTSRVGPAHRSTADDRPMWAAPTPRQLLLVRCPVPGYRVGELVGAA